MNSVPYKPDSTAPAQYNWYFPSYYLSGSPFIDEIVATRWKLDADGMLKIPEKPGLGLDLNRDAVAKYTYGERLFD